MMSSNDAMEEQPLSPIKKHAAGTLTAPIHVAVTNPISNESAQSSLTGDGGPNCKEVKASSVWEFIMVEWSELTNEWKCVWCGEKKKGKHATKVLAHLAGTGQQNVALCEGKMDCSSQKLETTDLSVFGTLLWNSVTLVIGCRI